MAGIRTRYAYPQTRYLFGKRLIADRPRQNETTFRGQVVGDTEARIRRQANSSPMLILDAGSRLWPQVEQ